MSRFSVFLLCVLCWSNFFVISTQETAIQPITPTQSSKSIKRFQYNEHRPIIEADKLN